MAATQLSPEMKRILKKNWQKHLQECPNPDSCILFCAGKILEKIGERWEEIFDEVCNLIAVSTLEGAQKMIARIIEGGGTIVWITSTTPSKN